MKILKFTFSQSCKIYSKGLYEFAVVLAKEILLLFSEFMHQNFDYRHRKVSP